MWNLMTPQPATSKKACDYPLNHGKTPLSNDFGLNKEDLAHLMNAWQEKALSEA
jgi:hypothetical protein